MIQQAQLPFTSPATIRVPQPIGQQPMSDPRIHELPLQGPSMEDFTIYLQYIAEHFRSDQHSEAIDSTGLWDTYEQSAYAHRPDLNPVILLESLRRRRAALGSFPLLRAKDLTRIRESYHRQSIAA